MRTALNTIQQTLTAEASALLSQAIGEAARRHHGQTTPLHVAASLLSSSSGILRQACVRSHPQSSHPLQCRALELCFSVALDRLPSSSPSNITSSSVTEPPISNALWAALKRAQAQQRRGCPEQQQQPLLAIKVELDRLVLSILDDPSVSRVMREASFSSPSVKANIEQSLSPSTAHSSYQIPFFSTCYSTVCSDDAKRVLEIMARGDKRNPVLVGDSDPRPIVRDVLSRIEAGVDRLVPTSLRGAKVVSLEKDFAKRSMIVARIRELGASIESSVGDVSVVVDLGDLKWLVEGACPAKQKPLETARLAVVEMAKLLRRFDKGDCQRMWFLGMANCATYLRCQVYHPLMEENWDLQAVPIIPRSTLPHLLSRLGANGILGSSKEPLPPVTSFPAATTVVGVPPRRSKPSLDSSDSSQKSSLCSLCMEDYEHELAKIISTEFESSSSTSKKESRNPLPSWLQIAEEQDHSQPKEQELKWKQKSAELLKRRQDNCSKLHPHSSAVLIDSRKPTSLNVSSALPLPPKLNISGAISTQQISSSEQASSPPDSPVKTDLILGQSKASKLHRDRVEDSADCKQDKTDYPCISELDSFKRIFHGLTERVAWQTEAASAIATAIVQCKSGHRKPINSKGAIWLLFDGHDEVGKLKMAAALSELMFGTTPLTVRLARASPIDKNYFDSDTVLRGKTSMDRVADTLSRNPFSVIVIEDINSANNMDKKALKNAMMSGRLPDSHGREISLQGAIFIILTDDSSLIHNEEKIVGSARSEWLLEFAILESVGKRQPESLLCKDERSIKRSRESPPGLSLDLNLAISVEDDENEDPAEGSRNSSDLTVEHEQENEHKRLVIRNPSEPTVDPLSWAAAELLMLVDELVLFQPVDFISAKRKLP